MKAFLASLEDEEDLRFEETGKTTLPLMCEDYVPFKTHSKKRARKVRKGSSSSVEIILGDEGLDLDLPAMPKHPHLVSKKVAEAGPSSGPATSTPCPPPRKRSKKGKGKEKAIDTDSDEEVTVTITVAGKKLEVPASRARVTVTIPVEDSSDSEGVDGGLQAEEDEEDLEIVF